MLIAVWTFIFTNWLRQFFNLQFILVEQDSLPKWRQLVWSQDCSMLACSYRCINCSFIYKMQNPSFLLFKDKMVCNFSNLPNSIFLSISRKRQLYITAYTILVHIYSSWGEVAVFDLGGELLFTIPQVINHQISCLSAMINEHKMLN